MTAAKDALYGDRDRRPERPPFCGANIPISLRSLPQWVGWKFIWKDEGWSKLPVDPNRGCRAAARTNDPSTWADFNTTINALNDRGIQDPAIAGPGFVFNNNGIVGLDIDGCRNPVTGELTTLAARIIREFGTYAEVSPSGLGVKIFARGILPWTKGKKVALPDGQDLELYDRVRYFTVTGIRIGDAAELADCQVQVDALIAEFFPPDEAATKTPKLPGQYPHAHAQASKSKKAARIPGTPSDEKIIELICRRNRPLWNGDTSAHGGDDSRADLALCNLLAFYVGGPDADRIDSIFRRSGLYRDKWERPDYRAATIGKALESRSEYYDPSKNGKPESSSSIKPEWVEEAEREAKLVEADDAEANKPKPAAEVILAFFRKHYKPLFRRKTAIVCADGAEVSRIEACSVPNFKIIGELALASDAPKVNNTVSVDRLPACFKKWAPVAWGELLSKLPDEDEADLGDNAPSREEFRRLVHEAMLTQIVLGDVISGRDEGATQTERRSLIDWCKRFAKLGVWRAIRSYQCWCKLNEKRDGGELVLSVAIRHGLFSQIHADKRLRDVPPKTFTRRCSRYGVGSTSRAERPHGQNAIVLDPEFIDDLVMTIPEDPQDLVAEGGEAEEFFGIPEIAK